MKNFKKNLQLLHKKLINKKLTLSVAESCTGGLLATNLTRLADSSKFFQIGLVTYSNLAKIKILKVNKELINKHGAVSNKCCSSMVVNLSKLSKSNINISITGIAGPNGGTKDKPVGLVYIGLKKGNKTIIKKKLFTSPSRLVVQLLTVNEAIKMTLKII
jgi:nicotinamide-nucleotide amidase